MTWWNFILAYPVFLAGAAWAWLCDMFNRGRVWYGLMSE